MPTQEIVFREHICTDEDNLQTILTQLHDFDDVVELGLNLGIPILSLKMNLSVLL